MTKADLIAALDKPEVVEAVAKSICEGWYKVAGRDVQGRWDAYNQGGKENFRHDARSALSEIKKLLPDDGPGESQPRVHRPNKCDPGPCDFRPGVPLMCCINCEEYY